ncbi:Transport and Golgi organization 2 homolog [Linum perenne]
MELHERPDAKSRGELPLLFLESCKSPREFAEGLVNDAQQFNGFNLILSDISSNTMVYVTNRPKGSEEEEAFIVHDVSPGLHVVSNANLDSPDWPKVQKLGLGFKEQLLNYGEGEIPLKEIGKKLGRCGTRSTIALAITRNGEVSFDETYLEDGTWKEKTISYRIQNTHKIKQLNK